MDKQQIIEEIQKMAVKIVATNPAGNRLLLIGGFRYRLLDASARTSTDLDYHWPGDLEEKQQELIVLFQTKLLPEVNRAFGYEGTVKPATGPNSESDDVKVIELAFYKMDVSGSRIEIPVDVTRIECLDAPIVKTGDGVVFLTASEADMIESKIIAVLNRVHVEARDLIDIFLFQNRFGPDAPDRIARKLVKLSLNSINVSNRLKMLTNGRKQYVRAIGKIIETQFTTEVADRIMEGGGAETVFDQSIRIIQDKVGVEPAK